MTDELRQEILKLVKERHIVTIKVSDGYVVATSPELAAALYEQVRDGKDEVALVILKTGAMAFNEADNTFVLNPPGKA